MTDTDKTGDVDTQTSLFESHPSHNNRLTTGLVFPTLLTRLTNTVSSRCFDDPTREQTIVVPSQLLGAHIRESLLKTLGGLFGVSILTPVGFARSITKTDLARSGLVPLPRHASGAVIAEAIRQTLDETSMFCPTDSYDDPRYRTNFQDAVLRAIVDEKKQGFSPRELGERGDPTGTQAALAAIYEASERIVGQNGWIDATDVMVEAAKLLKEGPTSPDATLDFFGLCEVSEVESALVDSAVEGGWPVHVWLPWIDDAPVFAPVKKWRAHLLDDLELSPTVADKIPDRSACEAVPRLWGQTGGGMEIDVPIELLSAADPVEEWRQVARWIWERLEADHTLNPSDIVILHPDLDQVRPIALDVLDEALLPVYDSAGAPLETTAAGRCLTLLMDVIAARLSRSQVVELLRMSGGPHNGSWDRLTRMAGVIGGVVTASRTLERMWIKPLDDLRSRLERKLEHGNADVGEAARTDIDALFELQSRVEQLVEVASVLASGRTESWRDWIDAVRRGYQIVVPVDAAYPEDATHLRDVEAVFYELAGYDSIAPLPKSESLRRSMLIEALEGGSVRNQQPYPENAIFLGRLDIVPPKSAKIVAIMGLVDPQFPKLKNRSHFAFGTDEEIDVSGQNVDMGIARGRLSFALALCAAEKTVLLSYPRASVGGSTVRPPSDVIVETLRQIGGDSGPLDDKGVESRLRVTPNRWIAKDLAPPIDTKTPMAWLSVREFDLAHALGFASSLREAMSKRRENGMAFERGLSAVEARESDRLTTYDGCIDGEFSVGDHQGVATPTSLETYAICPFRYFARSVLWLKQLDDPALQLSLDPRDSGDLVHRMLAAVFGRLSSEERFPLTEKSLDDLLSQLDSWTDEHLFGTKDRVWPAHMPPVARDNERQRLLTILKRVLSDGVEESAESWVPAQFEVAFGIDSKRRGEGGDGWSVEQPVELPGGDGLTARGRIDRIDVGDDSQSARIIDYKSGSPPQDAGRAGPFAGGVRLQLAAYLLGAEKVLGEKAPGVNSIEASYWFLREPGHRYEKLRHLNQESDEITQAFGEVVSAIVSGISSGSFPAHPYKDPSHHSMCRWCDYKEMCGPVGPIELRRAATKSDERVEKFWEMRRKHA